MPKCPLLQSVIMDSIVGLMNHLLEMPTYRMLWLFVEIGTYYCYFSQHKGKSQKKWAGSEELWNDKKQQPALEHHKQRRERGIE